MKVTSLLGLKDDVSVFFRTVGPDAFGTWITFPRRAVFFFQNFFLSLSPSSELGK